ncbi:MAG: hypothetical protein EOR43_23070 [Mesorhizobium sp.]|uniref:DUF6236 family protein n=1 Tax=Mesorhizobium sp. TaxID=1871066 RepID=UPI000FE42445|nr:DUF6236 family protein [Mesorhizobium sp.]RWK19808.1 MAG: hypothetical protein EOR43_23070 [Mesorhizobium sp.]RWK28813.1 MAG: hypothetical protein EOR44_21970 [Mesorhizobium sp.]
MRGLVVSPPIQIDGESVFVRSGDLDPQEVRSNLLFWDKLDFPTQSLIGFGLGADSQFLENAGVLQRTNVHVPSGSAGNILRAAHVGAFRLLDQKEPGQWSIATGERSISFSSNDIDEGRGVLVKLYNAIPVPNEDASLVDILEFRERRRSELLALRHHLEDVYQRVISAGDGPLAWNTEVEQLQIAIADHVKAGREAPFKFRLADIGASLNLVPIGVGALSAYSMGLPLIPGIVAGAAAGLSLEVGGALKGRSAVSTPFKYISSYHREIF